MRKLTLDPNVTNPSAVKEPTLYVKVVSGVLELFYQDSDGNEVQITSGGAVNA